MVIIKKPQNMIEFIILLGNSSLATRSRVGVAVKYAKSKPHRMVFSGRGTINDESEAQNMKHLAKSLGYDTRESIIEEKSMTTYENVKYTLKRLQDLGWFDTSYTTGYIFTICTSKYHRGRTLLIALSLLGPFGGVQIIHDNDEGDKKRQRGEEKGLIDYTNFFCRNHTFTVFQ